MEQFFEDINVLPVAPVFERYGTEKARLRLAGTPTGDFDLLIGCTSVEEDMVMVTENVDDFNPETYYKDQVEIEVWPTIEELRTQAYYNKGQHTEDFLYNYDWVFRRILEVSNGK